LPSRYVIEDYLAAFELPSLAPLYDAALPAPGAALLRAHWRRCGFDDEAIVRAVHAVRRGARRPALRILVTPPRAGAAEDARARARRSRRGRGGVGRAAQLLRAVARNARCR
jgi:hypothetical protein